MRRYLVLLSCCLAGALSLVSCDEEESAIGIGLQDPATLYNGTCDTLLCSATTVLDDSLHTAGYTAGLLGYYGDDVFGTCEASIYTQVTTPDGIDLSNSTIDSIVVTLGVSNFYLPQNQGFVVGGGGSRLPRLDLRKHTVDLNLEVRQLADTMQSDSGYCSNHTLPLADAALFQGVVTVNTTDTVVRIKLNDGLNNLLEGQNLNSTAFRNTVKGLYIAMHNVDNYCMLTVNFAATSTRLTIYRTYVHEGNDNERESLVDVFNIGTDAAHFNHYEHNYTGTLSGFNTDRHYEVDGSRYLYMEPMGGTKLRLDFDEQIQRFHAQHPYAIIHYAELLLPVATDVADANPPTSLLALRNYGDTNAAYIADMSDIYTSGGFDGQYDSGRRLYRIRCTQHVQKLLRQGGDEGTYIIINSRRAAANRTVLKGSDPAATANDPVRIAIVYTEPVTEN